MSRRGMLHTLTSVLRLRLGAPSPSSPARLAGATGSRSVRACLALIAALGAGCNPTSEENFLAGRGQNPCIEVIPACPGLWASCVLDTGNYQRTTFPGSVHFMTRADPEVEIEVAMYLMDQRDAGVSTQIYWNEPACAEVYTYDSGGANLFEEAIDHVLRKRMRVHQGGDHLIEIVTDMQCIADVTIDLIEPGA